MTVASLKTVDYLVDLTEVRRSSVLRWLGIAAMLYVLFVELATSLRRS